MSTPDRPAPTVLVVEDDDVTRRVLAAVLGRAGYGVIVAGDGQQALARLLSGQRPDLILLDMLMPVLDGWHFLNSLKLVPIGSIPIVITTGTILTREWAAAHGCAGFLRKPIEPDDLLAEVRRVLDGR